MRITPLFAITITHDALSCHQLPHPSGTFSQEQTSNRSSDAILPFAALPSRFTSSVLSSLISLLSFHTSISFCTLCAYPALCVFIPFASFSHYRPTFVFAPHLLHTHISTCYTLSSLCLFSLAFSSLVSLYTFLVFSMILLSSFLIHFCSSFYSASLLPSSQTPRARTRAVVRSRFTEPSLSDSAHALLRARVLHALDTLCGVSGSGLAPSSSQTRNMYTFLSQAACGPPFVRLLVAQRLEVLLANEKTLKMSKVG